MVGNRGRRRTLIVDDEEEMRFLLRVLIERANEGLEIVGEATTAHEALASWRTTDPDVIVLDYRMPGLSGLDIARQILAEDPSQRIILFSAYLDDQIIEEALALGICAVLSKDRYRDVPEALWECGPAA